MANFLKKAIGEMSKLRNRFASFGWGFLGGSFTAPYKLDSSRVDYTIARQLYDNTHDDYKLGAGFARPVINTTVGFMGIPTPKIEDENAQEILDDFREKTVSKLQRTIRNALRDGDCFVWITREDTKDNKLYPEKEKVLVYNIIPPEQVKKINRDPLTGRPIEYVLESIHEWEDENGAPKKTKIIQRISNTYRKIQCVGDVPPGIEEGEHPNPWGFIPIVHFKNESDEHEEFGKSDLEPIEPFLKAYHDVLLHAIQGSKLHSTPRLKLKLKDVEAFLRNNFGVTDPAKFAREGKAIDLDGREILLFSQDEDAEFIEARSATGDAGVLLKFLFYCIVDTSETPEFVFGVHTPSSQASVTEQMPILIRKIERKRDLFDEPIKLLYRIVLAITAESENKTFSTYAVDLEWPEIDPRDSKEAAEEIRIVAEALDIALRGGFISHEAAVEFLAQYITTMRSYETENDKIPGEKDRIMKTRLMSMQLEDAQFNEEQLVLIDKILEKLEKVSK